MEQISKRLFIIWLGNNCPMYVSYAIHAYKEANPTFEVKFINYNINSLKSIYLSRNISTIEDDLLAKSIDVIMNNDDKYRNVLDKCFFYYAFMHQKDQYGDNMRIIQVLSDVYRLMLIDHFGGIYVDADTFPLKPFDESLLKLKNFIVSRHYGGKKIHTIDDDNYFFGSLPNMIQYHKTKVLQTNDNWWTSTSYIARKNMFFNGKLKYNEDSSQPFYIEHFFDNNWVLKNGIIKTPLCFLDQIYRERRGGYANR